jgi:Protein of unknown function (DUF2971)
LKRIESKRRSRRATAFTLPKLVWHYTTFRGLEGILGGNIWASSAAYLNDAEEFRYGVKVAFAEFAAQIEEYAEKWDMEPARNVQPHYSRALMLRSIVRRQFIGVLGKDVFVTSFSTREDDLSQWRAYGGAGPSFAVGFDAHSLAKQASELGFKFQRVRYGRKQIRGELKRTFFPRIRTIFAEHEPNLVDKKLHDIKRKVTDELHEIAAFAKHESFEDEEEWRLACRAPLLTNSKLALKFRLSSSLVVPYVEIPLHDPWPDNAALSSYNGDLVVSSIVAVSVGPSPHPKELKQAVEEMVERRGLHHIEVSSSTVPFRNW